ncbi:response regulator transcription factor [bacterium]|nr:MAG: response regulator transcription factor [bacterium]
MLYPTLKIVIADDHSLIRQGLRLSLETQVTKHVFEADNGADALKLIQFNKPDVAILDVEMPVITGYEVALKTLEKNTDTKIIFLTMYKDDSMFNKAMDLGVKGYVLKENTVTEIMHCLEAVIQGNQYVSPAIEELLNKRNSKSQNDSQLSINLENLTVAEKNIIKLLSMMKTSQEIADELNISIKTVQNHRNNICGKLGLTGAHALLKFAIEHAELIQ